MENFIIFILAIIAVETSWLSYVSLKTRQPGSKSFRAVFIDTSVIVDGRILSIVQAGFMRSDLLYIPRSVIRELQMIADSSDNEKRAKARRGLDTLADLQAIKTARVEIYKDSPDAREGVDERLMQLAKKHNGAICTIDFNLNKVASVQGIEVVNINDLAMNLRMTYLPGDRFLIEINQKGSEATQAVGHLADGTMVVVENARKLIGSVKEVETIRSLQTSAGRMIFAKLVSTPVPTAKPNNQKPSNKRYTKPVSKEEQMINLANSR